MVVLVIRGALIFTFGCAFGVLVYDQALERAAKPQRSLIPQPYAAPVRFARPIQCDATVDGKCYIRGMK